MAELLPTYLPISAWWVRLQYPAMTYILCFLCVGTKFDCLLWKPGNMALLIHFCVLERVRQQKGAKLGLPVFSSPKMGTKNMEWSFLSTIFWKVKKMCVRLSYHFSKPFPFPKIKEVVQVRLTVLASLRRFPIWATSAVITRFVLLVLLLTFYCLLWCNLSPFIVAPSPLLPSHVQFQPNQPHRSRLATVFVLISFLRCSDFFSCFSKINSGTPQRKTNPLLFFLSYYNESEGVFWLNLRALKAEGAALQIVMIN